MESLKMDESNEGIIITQRNDINIIVTQSILDSLTHVTLKA